jgi:aldehyde dehydrogenase (NAD+)
VATQEQRTSIVWDYAPAPESPDHVRLRDSYGLFIDGEFQDPVDGTRVASINPATEEPVAEVAFAGPEDVQRAIQASRAAQPGWAALSGLDRGKYLFRVARLIQERARELAVVESMDGGKPIRESRDVDVPLAAAHFFHYAGWADKLSYAMGGRTVEPLGVAGQIVPWNFPLLMAAWKLAPALAAGNTAVLKPAETTPLTALLLAEILQEAELPPGVVSIVPGDGATGAALVREPDIDKVAFTGSTGVGKDIQAALAGRGIPLTLELGGKSANIVF